MRTLLIEDEPLARDELRYHVTAAGLEVVGKPAVSRKPNDSFAPFNPT
ncbi:hypothetical protein [uncultured Exiguobacterium sp.]|nr:hypothetical protein [uncultured Exiguobacterium sp.]